VVGEPPTEWQPILPPVQQDSGAMSEDATTLVTDETMKLVLQRVAQRSRRGEAVPSVILPSQKSEFPKVLCLDQNHWIYLAQAHFGKGGGQQHRSALDAIRAATERRRLVVPVLSSNAFEVTKPNNAGARLRLATFMVELSGNFSAVNGLPIKWVEMRNAVLSLFGGVGRPIPIREGLIQWGMTAAITGRNELASIPNAGVGELINQVTREPELSAPALAQYLDRETVANFRKSDVEVVGVLENARLANLDKPPAARKHWEVHNFLSNARIQSILSSILTELRVDASRFGAWLSVPANLDLFAEHLPGIDVMASLMMLHDRNLQHRTDPNDTLDLQFLEVGIPYANIVVTEREWAAIANSGGVARKYGTVVLGALATLPEVLAEAGCL
jgi:hypothetical protein